MSLDFFVEKRLRLQKVPFEDSRAQANFQIPLEQWKDICINSLNERRAFYRVPRFFDMEEVKKNAHFQCTFFSRKTKGVIQVYLVRESVTQFEADGVINAANESLLSGGGIDKAIHEGAGPNLIKECAFLNGCKTGEAVITKGYDLPAKYVLHTVGPILKAPGQEDNKVLHRCYQSCLELCDQYDLKSIAIPCVACGFYGYPLNKSANLIKNLLQDYVDRGYPTVKNAIFSLPREEEWNAYYSIFAGASL